MSEQGTISELIAVVIVDPNDISRRALNALLGEHDDLVITDQARSCDQIGPDAAREADVAILGEVRDPGAIIEALRQQAPRIKVIVMAHLDDGEIPFHAIQAGADGLVPLSAGAVEVKEAIRAVTETGTAIDPYLAIDALRWAAGHEAPTPNGWGEPHLTAREQEILEHLAEGHTAAGIAAQLGLSRRTVEAHLANAYRKLGVHSRFEALARVRAMSRATPGALPA
jgi:DNA-binding NarL/FixJ family response regulator